MRLKSFYAKTMMEAMQQVRDTLGENAIIVASREEGGSVRLTAAIDEDTPASIALGFGTRMNSGSQTPAQEQDSYDDIAEADAAEAEEGAVVDNITDVLLRHGTPTDVMDALIATATMVGLEDTASTLLHTFEQAYAFYPLPAGVNRKPVMLVGVPGSGKTLFATKLAARAVLNNMRPALITTDTQRAGGTEQLAAFTKILNIPLLQARTAAELRDALKTLKEFDCIYIDTSGANPFEVDDMRALAQLAETGPIEPVLVQAAGGDAEEMAEIARCFAILGAQRQAFTRLDITRKMGGVLAAAQKGGLAFCDYSSSPMPSSGFGAMSAKGLVSALIGHSETAVQKNIRKNTQTTTIRGKTSKR